MGSKEIFEKAKGIIGSYHEEAARAAEQKAQKARERKEEARKVLMETLERERLADERWKSVRGGVLEVVQEVNQAVLDGKGNITGWTRRKVAHTHEIYESFSSGWGYDASDGLEGVWRKTDYTFQVEQAELRIESVGKVVLMRSLQELWKERWAEHPKTQKRGGAGGIYIVGLYLEEDGHYHNYYSVYRDNPCPECRHYGRPELTSIIGNQESLVDTIRQSVVDNLLLIHSMKFKGKPESK